MRKLNCHGNFLLNSVPLLHWKLTLEESDLAALKIKMSYEIKTINSDQITKLFSKIITPPYQRPLDGQHLKQLTDSLKNSDFILGTIVLCKFKASYYIADGQHRYYVIQNYLTRKTPKVFKVSIQIITVQKEDDILHYYQMCNNVSPHSDLDQEVIEKKGSSESVQKNKTISSLIDELRNEYPEHFKNLKKMGHYTFHMSQLQLKKELGESSFYTDSSLFSKIQNCNNQLKEMKRGDYEALIEKYRGKLFARGTLDSFYEIEQPFYLSLIPFEAWKVLLDKYGSPRNLIDC